MYAVILKVWEPQNSFYEFGGVVSIQITLDSTRDPIGKKVKEFQKQKGFEKLVLLFLKPEESPSEDFENDIPYIFEIYDSNGKEIERCLVGKLE